ncbi:MAG: MoaD/ThiS family protein [Myxococcales bacterium]|nr:MoaD/ThiS family protein [Myxococcales bacterium]
MATVRIPTPLRKHTDGQEEVSASGTTIDEILTDLDKNYPGIKARICDEYGAVRKFVNIFANEEDIRYLDNLQTPIKDSDEVSMIPAIAGGAA